MNENAISFEDCNILITGVAGFIGFHLANYLLNEGHRICGFDNLNSYYDVKIKEERLKILREYSRFSFARGDMSDATFVEDFFCRENPNIVVSLAAQAGVRYSIENPRAYINSNIIGFFNLLEACRHHPVDHLIFASSSSVYGNRHTAPFRIKDSTDQPVSLYAATKKSNELMAYTYSHLYKIPTTGLRFFTVYGPWGRPDMAYYKFANCIMEETSIKVYNNGNMYRDFTYIDDVVEGINKMMFSAPPGNQGVGPYRIYNIGGNRPENLLKFIECLEMALGKKAIKEYFPMQAGDVYMTCADTTELERDFLFKPKIGIEEGLKKFANWYKKFNVLRAGGSRLNE